MAKIKKAQYGATSPKPPARKPSSSIGMRSSLTKKPSLIKGPYKFEKNVPSGEQMRKDFQMKEREMTTRKPSPNDRMPLKKGGKVRKAQTGENLPSVTVTSKAAPKKNLMERMFGTKEERQDRKLDRENRRLERQANRQANRAERQGNRACRRAGRCGGRGMGFIGYDKNGGTTKKARTGTKVSKSSKKK